MIFIDTPLSFKARPKRGHRQEKQLLNCAGFRKLALDFQKVTIAQAVGGPKFVSLS